MTDYGHYLKSIPIIPDVAARILSITEEKLDISFRELEGIIKVDPGLTAKILRVANSALYARQKEVKSLQMAITLLGFKNIKSLVLLITASTMFQKQKQTDFYQYFWKHSILNAFMAKDMSERTGNRASSDEHFLAGLLHDIGQVALHNASPEDYARVVRSAAERRTRISEAERELFSTDHKEVGGAILKEWSLPDVYVAAAREHGSGNITSEHKQVILIVSAADFVTSNLDLYVDDPLDTALMEDVVRQTALTGDDLDYYLSEFPEVIRDDHLFQECQNLFELKAS